MCWRERGRRWEYVWHCFDFTAHVCPENPKLECLNTSGWVALAGMVSDAGRRMDRRYNTQMTLYTNDSNGSNSVNGANGAKSWVPGWSQMPGDFQNMLSASNVVWDTTISETRDMMSPLTLHHSEVELTWISIESDLVLRTDSPLGQIYTEGVIPWLRDPIGGETPMDPHIALTMVNNFLKDIQCQWMLYRQGPEGFNHHEVNSSSYWVIKLKHLIAALAREADDKSTSKAESQGARVPIKLEDEGTGPSRLKDADKWHHQEGLAPSTPDHPTYLQYLDATQI